MSLGATAADIALGFAPGIGTAQGIRDFERARREDNVLGMVLGGLSAIPVAGGIVRAGKGVGRAAGGALDMSQAARMQRADDQGFHTNMPLYHATNQSFGAFEIPERGFLKYGKGVYTSPSSKYSNRYIQLKGSGLEPAYNEGANVMPVYVRGKIATEKDWEAARQEMLSEGTKPAGYNPMQEEIKRRLQAKGFDGLNMFGNEVVIYDPANIRSINAAFDPAKRGSSNLMAGVAGAAVTSSALRALVPQEQERRPD